MTQEITVSSLFSGCGGLDLGFKQAGFNIVWANEIDKDAASTYSKFIDHNIIVEDINRIINKIPKTDILIGGPPCQSFSLVGKRIDDDPRGKLVFAYLKAVIRAKPRVFLMENVPGLCASYFNNERLHIYLFKQLSKLGYKVEFFKLNSVDFCVPQLRKRVFLVGQTLKASLSLFNNEEFAKQTRYGTRIAHGALLVGFISTVMGKIAAKIPPPGGVSYRYDVKFTAPVKFGDTVTTELTIIEKNVDRKEIISQIISTNQRGEKVLEGKTTLKVI